MAAMGDNVSEVPVFDAEAAQLPVVLPAQAGSEQSSVSHTVAHEPSRLPRLLGKARAPPMKEMTPWRLPQENGKLPAYVKRTFRVKALCLLTVQYMSILGILFIMEAIVAGCQCDFAMAIKRNKDLLVLSIGAIVVLAMAFLMGFAKYYPVNYAWLFIVTVLLGIFWGITGMSGYAWLPNEFHFTLVGTAAIAMASASLCFLLVSRWNLSARRQIAVSLFSGWLVGSIAMGVVGYRWLHQSYGSVFATAGLTLFLFGMLIFHAGTTLVRCNPDDFLKVIIAADSVLFLVCIPVWVLSFCWLHCSDAPAAEDDPGAGAVA
jgi:MFS family permease